MCMKYLNLYKSREVVPECVGGYYLRLEGLTIERKSDRRSFLQSMVSSLNRMNFDAAVAPKDLSDNFDIVVLSVSEDEVENIVKKYSNLGPKIIKAKISRKDIIERAWQNRVRIELVKREFLKIGDRYILKKDIVNRINIFKRAYKVQAILVGFFPSLLVDPRTRIMIPLEDEKIDQADFLGEESKVEVRILPYWQRGILVGRTGKKAEDMEFPLGNRMLKTSEYWKIKHNINFVSPRDEMLKVYVPAFEKKLPYPESCVFSEFRSRTSLPENLKKDPNTRVSLASEFVQNHLTSIIFLKSRIMLQGPTLISSLGYGEYNFPPRRKFPVVVGGNKITTITALHSALRQSGPYAGKIDGKYVVVHFDNEAKLLRAFKSIEKAYSQLNLGKLELLTDVGNKGLISTGGENVTDYTSTIAELRPKLATKNGRILVIVVLPDAYASEVYYKSRDKLFERIFGFEPLPTQAISSETLDIIYNGETAYPICITIASQCYVKLGGTGAAVWILHDPADISISGIPPGSSCYAYHDVSRRPKIKASATAYSAMTDSYGRYIATGTKPIGGEKLTPSGFYDIFIELLQKASIFSQRYSSVSGERKFNFQRLVFAKDGIIEYDEADMMEQVILNGIPEERKEPIPSLLKKISMFPNNLIVDVIDVNKTPAKRIFEFKHGFDNVSEGTAISYNESKGLLVSCSSPVGTVQPIEISLKKHLCLNREKVQAPHISQLMEEYYRLTHLNWASIFKQGKYALPQILTQNLGENISAGVLVPDDMILL